MMKLRIEEEREARTVELPDGPAVVGRAKDADIRIEEPRASRRHLEIRPAPGGAVVRDLGSTNGIVQAGRRLVHGRIFPGDRFLVGETWFTLVADEAPAPARRPARTGRGLVGALVPALVLLVLVEAGAQALSASRAEEIAGAGTRLEKARFDLVSLSLRKDPETALAELTDWLEAHPDSPWSAEAEAELARLRPQVRRIRDAQEEFEALNALRASDELPFTELYYRYERLLGAYGDLPDVSERIRGAFRELKASHREKLEEMVDGVRAEAVNLAKDREYGRAVTLLASFVERSPEAATTFEEDLSRAESEVMRLAQIAYRSLLSRSDALVDDGKVVEGAELLSREAGRFHGTRFRAFLRMRAETLRARSRGDVAKRRTEDEISLRRRYFLLSQEAEEMATAGRFLRAAEKYESILDSVTIEEMREEFELRMKELRGLDRLLAEVKGQIVERGPKFGGVRFGDATFRVVGMVGGVLQLEHRGGAVSRPWDSLKAKEVLALLRRARLAPKMRLLVAVYCFDMNLRAEFEAEILELLENEELREFAGILYARKQGRPHPPGGFVAHKGRILTRAEHAEVVHRERVATLRNRQVELYGKLTDHAIFRKLAKIRELRDRLDEAREHALALIFDEVKYFYPYRHRMAEYQPVQMEVNDRVSAVRAVWDDPKTVSLKPDSSLQSILGKIEATNGELRGLGVVDREFERDVADLTIYLGRTLNVRSYFRDRVELSLLEYNDRVMEWNRKAETAGTKLEVRQVEVTNEYRMMMGRRALVIDDRLLLAARGHCEEMARLGFFGHFSPTPERRTPHQRVALQGYKGSAVSENCHKGSGTAEGAHQRWCQSSGHHRNILQRFWTEMGTGQHGNLWTQNFGRTKPKEFPSEEEK